MKCNAALSFDGCYLALCAPRMDCPRLNARPRFGSWTWGLSQLCRARSLSRLECAGQKQRFPAASESCAQRFESGEGKQQTERERARSSWSCGSKLQKARTRWRSDGEGPGKQRWRRRNGKKMEKSGRKRVSKERKMETRESREGRERREQREQWKRTPKWTAARTSRRRPAFLSMFGA